MSCTYCKNISVCAICGKGYAEEAERQRARESDEARLMRFYGVDSLSALVAAQHYHIEKLQAKLPQAPSFAPQRVREG